MKLTGIHHVTAVTSNAKNNYQFYTAVLGLRLVKKTVNQDDVRAYHLFYADGEGSPGTDLTFFEWPVPQEIRGTNSISTTGLRVTNTENVSWWKTHLASHNVAIGESYECNGRLVLPFTDPEGQRLEIVADPEESLSKVWAQSTIPKKHQISGLGPVQVSVPTLAPTEKFLTEVLQFEKTNEISIAGSPTHIFKMLGVGAASELHLRVDTKLSRAQAGAGGVHHVAFRTPNVEEYHAWNEILKKSRLPFSGAVDRFYFQSLYVREPNGILFEIATDGPGFAVDEPKETLGKHLALPPFLEAQRKSIEEGLHAID